MRELESARHELAHAIGILRLAMGRLARALEEGRQAPPETGATADEVPPALTLEEYRGKHLPGNPFKPDIDEEVRVFVVARLDHMSYVQIAAEVAENLPPDRRVGKTSISNRARRRHPR